MNAFHKEILSEIQRHSGKPTQHTFLDSYLGNSHPRYPIAVPKLRSIAKIWMASHRDLPVSKFSALLTSLIKGKSSTEKCMAGILLDYSKVDQRKFDPALFNTWLNYLEGWVEVDTLCTSRYTVTEIVAQWKDWKPQINQFSKSKNINKRRASLVLFCHSLRKVDDARLAAVALQNVARLSSENEILITKAISWLLRSMIKLYRPMVEEFIQEHSSSLPKIALRETLTKLETGRKTKLK